MNRAYTFACLFASLLFVAPPVLAQPGGGGGFGGRGVQLTEDETKAAWKLEVQTIAASLHVDDQNAIDTITKAYAKARMAMAADQRNLFAQMRGGGGGEGGFAAMRDKFVALRTKHRNALHDSLGDVLNGQQLDEAMRTLGSFSELWDVMIHTVAGFGLKADSQRKALQAVAVFVGQTGAARDMGAIDTARASFKAAMHDAGLDDDQVAEVTRFTQLRRGGRGGGRGRGG